MLLDEQVLSLHYREAALPPLFAQHVGQVVGENSAWKGLPISELFSQNAALAESIKGAMRDLVISADDRLREWVGKYYADLPSLPVAKGPIMVHHVPRYLAMRRGNGEKKIALVVFDGLAVDQWIQIRESVINRSQRLMFDENACFGIRKPVRVFAFETVTIAHVFARCHEVSCRA